MHNDLAYVNERFLSYLKDKLRKAQHELEERCTEHPTLHHDPHLETMVYNPLWYCEQLRNCLNVDKDDSLPQSRLPLDRNALSEMRFESRASKSGVAVTLGSDKFVLVGPRQIELLESKLLRRLAEAIASDEMADEFLKMVKVTVTVAAEFDDIHIEGGGVVIHAATLENTPTNPNRKRLLIALRPKHPMSSTEGGLIESYDLTKEILDHIELMTLSAFPRMEFWPQTVALSSTTLRRIQKLGTDLTEVLGRNPF